MLIICDVWSLRGCTCVFRVRVNVRAGVHVCKGAIPMKEAIWTFTSDLSTSRTLEATKAKPIRKCASILDKKRETILLQHAMQAITNLCKQEQLHQAFSIAPLQATTSKIQNLPKQNLEIDNQMLRCAKCKEDDSPQGANKESVGLWDSETSGAPSEFSFMHTSCTFYLLQAGKLVVTDSCCLFLPHARQRLLCVLHRFLKAVCS